ncbi:MAG: hypothetical protein ABSG17_02795 [Spirochaetia bacterium]|jgi:AcrR family transcriptional regulator
MTQRVSFPKETVVDAAFLLTRERGWAAVTARNIAQKLSSSTMPIYSSLKSMNEIESQVRQRAEKLLLEYQKRPYTDDVALNGALGYVMFARDERNLFRFLYEDRPVRTNRKKAARHVRVAPADVAAGKIMVNLVDQVPVAMRDPRILKTWIFTHGLASMIASGVLDLDDETIRSLLAEAGGAFFEERFFTKERKK